MEYVVARRSIAGDAGNFEAFPRSSLRFVQYFSDLLALRGQLPHSEHLHLARVIVHLESAPGNRGYDLSGTVLTLSRRGELVYSSQTGSGSLFADSFIAVFEVNEDLSGSFEVRGAGRQGTELGPAPSTASAGLRQAPACLG